MPSVKIAAEDRFGLVQLGVADGLAPHPFFFGTLSIAASRLEHWSVCWDLRESGGRLFGDVVDAYEEAASQEFEPRAVLVLPEERDAVLSAFMDIAKRRRIAVPQLVPIRAKPLPTR